MSIYENLYNLVSEYVYGGVNVGSYEELVTIMLSTIGVIFLVAIPFIIVYKVIKMVVGG